MKRFVRIEVVKPEHHYYLELWRVEPRPERLSALSVHDTLANVLIFIHKDWLCPHFFIVSRD